MTRRPLIAIVILSAISLACLAQENKITFNVLAEASYLYNFNCPNSPDNAFRVFDYRKNELRLDMVEFAVQKPVSEANDFGFRVDAALGQSVPHLIASNGLFRDTETGKTHSYDIHQVFLSWIAPIGKGLRIDAGKFVTPFGCEVIDGYDGYNDNQSRSFLFGYAIPYAHTGLRASYPFSDKITGTLFAVQGWDNWQDNNNSKSFGAQAVITPSPKWSIYLTAMGGPEQNENSRNKRYVYNAVGTYKINDKWTAGADLVYGNEKSAIEDGRTADWSGAAGYAKYSFSDTLSLAARAEVFTDSDGARTGTTQTLREVTLTPSLKLGKNFVLRGDLRLDASSKDVFLRQNDPVHSQSTASVQLIYIY
jgi:hypothetical protein